MRQVIYRPDRYVAETESSRLVVACDPKTSTYAVYPEDEETTMGRLPLDGDQALRLAAYILATHSEAAGSEDFEGVAFAPATASCADLPTPEFVVVPPVAGAEHTNPLQYRADLDERLAHCWEAHPEGPGELLPEQERRITALREVNDLFPHAVASTTRHLAEWVIDGRPETEGGEQA